MSLSTAGLCHMTPSESGTWPRIFLHIIFTNPPYRPVISVGGTRVAPDMSPPGFVHGFVPSTWRHRPDAGCDIRWVRPLRAKGRTGLPNPLIGKSNAPP